MGECAIEVEGSGRGAQSAGGEEAGTHDGRRVGAGVEGKGMNWRKVGEGGRGRAKDEEALEEEVVVEGGCSCSW